MNVPDLTDRQQRELDYQRQRAKALEAILFQRFSWGVLDEPHKRWWNAYWQMYAYLLTLDLVGKRVLVVGCGFGHDALRLAKLGAQVSAFDLSPESLEIAKQLAVREGVLVDFDQMASEEMRYPDSFFDCVVAVDILHHVDIPKTMREVQRVAKPAATFVMDEIYSHSWTGLVRHSWLVERVLYPRMQRLIYGPGKPYITADERKMTEKDISEVKQAFRPIMEKHFNFLVGRLLPDYDLPAKIDRALLKLLQPIGHLLAGRILAAGHIVK